MEQLTDLRNTELQIFWALLRSAVRLKHIDLEGVIDKFYQDLELARL